MNSEHPQDDLLWETGRRLDEPEPTREPSVADCEAYRRGSLDDEQMDEMEVALAASTAARDRLAESADVTASSPAVGVRQEVLAAYDEEFATGGRLLSWRTRSNGSRRQIWRGAALAASLLLAVLWLGRSGPTLPDDLHYEIAATGLAEVRGTATQDVLEVYADTMLTLDASPNRATEGVTPALFRETESEWSRVDVPTDRVQLLRGAVRVEAPAALLVGGTPGPGRLWIVLAADDSLPSSTQLAEQLRGVGGPVITDQWQAYRVNYELLRN